jgi:hypothetical protein
MINDLKFIETKALRQSKMILENHANTKPTFVKRTAATTQMDKLELFLACLTAFLTPINAARLPNIYFTLADLTALLCLVLIFANRGVPKRMFGSLTEFYILGLFVFCGSLLLSSIINGDAIRGLIGIGQYILAFLIFPIVLLRRTHKEAWLVAFAFLSSIAIVCLHGISIISFDMDVSTRYVTPTGRLRGLVERTNELGGLLGMTVPLVVVLTRTKWIPYYVGWAFLVVILYTTMLTGSNTGMVCYVVALVGTLLISESLSRNAAFLALAAILITLVFTVFGTDFLPEIFQERVLSAFRSGDIDQAGTLTDRLDLMTESLHLADSYLFIGMGFDQLREINLHGAPVHNLILLVLNEGGIFALFGLLILLIAILSQASLVFQRTKNLNAAAYFLVTTLVFCLVISGLPHAYARFLFIPWIVALGITSTIPYAQSLRRN